jgi:hypothetical protein
MFETTGTTIDSSGVGRMVSGFQGCRVSGCRVQGSGFRKIKSSS